mmetsp:Transcript_68719/g.183084  ORF Transcript_68719/g.183084 Transcript_68719/m.183084 type:complete len:88 (+) Transcript_68719:968-1231(+)
MSFERRFQVADQAPDASSCIGCNSHDDSLLRSVTIFDHGMVPVQKSRQAISVFPIYTWPPSPAFFLACGNPLQSLLQFMISRPDGTQ